MCRKASSETKADKEESKASNPQSYLTIRNIKEKAAN